MPQLYYFHEILLSLVSSFNPTLFSIYLCVPSLSFDSDFTLSKTYSPTPQTCIIHSLGFYWYQKIVFSLYYLYCKIFIIRPKTTCKFFTTCRSNFYVNTRIFLYVCLFSVTYVMFLPFWPFFIWILVFLLGSKGTTLVHFVL